MPEKAPRSVRGHAEAAKIDPKSYPEAECFPCGTIEKRCHCEFSKISDDYWPFRTDGDLSEVLRLPAKTEGRVVALRVDSRARWTLGKRRKSTPKSIQDCRKWRLEATRVIFSVGPGDPCERLERLRRPRRPWRAAQAAKASGPGGPGCSSMRAQTPSSASWQALYGNIVIEMWGISNFGGWRAILQVGDSMFVMEFLRHVAPHPFHKKRPFPVF